MARVPDFDISKASPPFAALLKAKHALNIYKVLPHAGKAGEAFLVMAQALLREGVFDPQLRELAIIRVGELCGSAYEVHQHTRIGRKVGLSDAQMLSLKVGADQSVLTATEKLVVLFTDEVVNKVKASEEVFARMQAQFGHAEIAELLMVIGYYMMVSRFLENFEVEIERPAGG